MRYIESAGDRSDLLPERADNFGLKNGLTFQAQDVFAECHPERSIERVGRRLNSTRHSLLSSTASSW